jgi:hypothetical protein
MENDLKDDTIFEGLNTIDPDNFKNAGPIINEIMVRNYIRDNMYAPEYMMTNFKSIIKDGVNISFQAIIQHIQLVEDINANKFSKCSEDIQEIATLEFNVRLANKIISYIHLLNTVRRLSDKEQQEQAVYLQMQFDRLFYG